jgi:hypothetical protein
LPSQILDDLLEGYLPAIELDKLDPFNYLRAKLDPLIFVNIDLLDDSSASSCPLNSAKAQKRQLQPEVLVQATQISTLK